MLVLCNKKILDNSYAFTFFIFYLFIFLFLALQETLRMSNETYGSDGFRVEFFRDEKGKFIKGDCLFHNIYDFWVSIHASGFMKVNRWYHPKVAKLEKVLITGGSI